MNSKFVVCAIQQSFEIKKEANLKNSIALIKTAAAQGAQLVVLPELHLGPYFCQSEDFNQFALAEPIPGPSTNILSDVAKELGIVIVSSIFEKRTAGLYHNTAVVFDTDGSIAGIYRKMHIPDDPGFYEKYYFTPGDLGFKPISTSLGKLGILVCWDQWFPEAARLMALSGAEILIYPTAIGWDSNDSPDEHDRQLDAWITVQRGHAVANGLSVVACNRFGFEPSPEEGIGINFWGNSFIAGPQGEFIKRAGAEKSELLFATIEKQRNERTRQIWPFLRDRRIENYGDLVKRFIDTSKYE